MAKVAFTAGRVSGFKCPPEKKQAFLWDAITNGLGVRTTPAGKPAYVFQGVYQGKDIRLTIGSPAAWSIPNAQAKARELQRLIDAGKDPRDLKRDAVADAQAKGAAIAAAAIEAAAHAVTVGEVWAAYVAERTPQWGELHRQDHERLTRAGGEVSSRGTRGRGVTIAGPLYPLLPLALRNLTAPVVEAWAAGEAQTRPTAARLAWRLLKAFLGWCAEQPQYAPVLPSTNPAKTRKAREALGKPTAKQDSLLKEQLSAWFAAVGNIGNPTVAAYLQTLLLTGARPGEVLAMRWDDLNTQWHGLTIRDKVEGERVIPLTPYVSHLLHGLPRRNAFVFASHRTDGASLTEPNHAHSKACTVAGIDGLTLHGLRRSFGTLTEWLEVPAGVVAQIQGHKPSATAEKHYRVRPLDLLRLHHEKIEAWILEQAGVQFTSTNEPGKLRLVNEN
ncbi:tyrosine-type recombinase/integrase [Simplicispira psychrophila]|uniref:tyrosine-type recombinase/integrase n=1 Tax=Simplicispira psychrophila TaxID=80882 RepID=UPI000488DB94|nr:site-specific integrase [Simplicispira psychrophila]